MVLESISLRPVQATDLVFLFQVYAGTRAEELAVVPWAPAAKDAFLRQQFEAQHRHYQTAYGDGQFSVVCLGAEDIGRLYVWRGNDDLRIIDIALLPGWRGRGLGSQLIRTLLDEAAAARKRVSIHVEQHNPALRLYQRLGFKPVAENGVYWLMEWTSPS